MTVHAYTSFTYSYLNRARVLASTLRQQHPDWVLWAVVTDQPPPGYTPDPAAEPFDHWITAQDLFGPDTDSWLFGHDIVEACTAVKGRALQHLLARPGCSRVVYLDPDIAVINPLTPALDLLDSHAIVLTPHQIDPEPRAALMAIRDNELASLTYGAFNLGFLAVANVAEGRRFADWWADRLQDWCHDRPDIGLFVDQRWCNLIPCFFDGVAVLRDPGFNVASWNLSQRRMAFDAQGRATINGTLLRFYHFTKFGPVGDTMTRRYADTNPEIFELWAWYRHRVNQATDPRIPPGWWHYATFDNGDPVPKQARELYRDRADLRQAFASPRSVGDGFHAWLRAEGIIARSA
jgi:hypothetical protein